MGQGRRPDDLVRLCAASAEPAACERVDLAGPLGPATPPDLEVRVTEVNIDRNVIRLDVDAEGYEAADRLTSVLSETSPFEEAEVAGSVRTDRKTGGVSFNVNIPLAKPGEEA